VKFWCRTGLALLSFFLIGAEFSAFAREEQPFPAFVEAARHPNSAATFAMLEGTLQHRRKGASTVSVPLYFGIVIQPKRSTGQLIVDGKESYVLGQTREEGGSTVVRNGAGNGMLDRAGVRASDLTLGFLFYPVVKELDSAVLNGFIPCRVGLFRAPDGSEEVKIYLSRDYRFPLKAEFFRKGGAEPYRTLECGGFTQENGIYYARRIRLEGPGWATRIEFDPDRAKVGLYNAANPPAVIREVPAETAKKK